MKKYRTIIADPPWKYKGRGPASTKKNIDLIHMVQHQVVKNGMEQ